MVTITVEQDIQYQLAGPGGIVGSQPYKKHLKVNTLSDWKLTEKLNGLKVFEFSVKNDELEKANIFVERDIFVPLLTPFKGIITSKQPTKDRVDFVAHEDAWHFGRRKFKCHDKARLKYTNENWYDRLWLRRRQLSIPEKFTKHISNGFKNLPLLIHITDVELKYHARIDGFDILFTVLEDEVPIKLKHKIEKYVPSTGELIVWVELPEVRDSTVKFQMYFDNPDAADQGSTTTFDNFNYNGVWLLEGNALDETSNNIDLTVTSAVTSTDGPYGNGSYEFDGVDDKLSDTDINTANIWRGSSYERDNGAPRIDTATITSGTLFASQLENLVPGDFITEVGLEATVASGNFRIKLYDDVDGRPTNLLSQTGAVAAATGVTEHFISKTEVPENGKVWIALESDTTIGYRGGGVRMGLVTHTFGSGPDPFGVPSSPGGGTTEKITDNLIDSVTQVNDTSPLAGSICASPLRLFNTDWEITEVGWMPAPTIIGNVRLKIFDETQTSQIPHPNNLIGETNSVAVGADNTIQYVPLITPIDPANLPSDRIWVAFECSDSTTDAHYQNPVVGYADEQQTMTHTFGTGPSTWTYTTSGDNSYRFQHWIKQEQPSYGTVTGPWLKVRCEPKEGSGAVGGWASAWIKARSDGEADIGEIMRHEGSDAWGFRGRTQAGEHMDLEFFHTTTSVTGTWLTDNEPINRNKWHRVDCIFNKTNVENDPTIFIDGLPVAFTETGTPTGVFSDNSGEFVIGNSSVAAETFDGFISTAKIHSNPPENTADLIALEYQAESNPDFIVIGQQEHYLEQADIIAQDIIDHANQDMPVVDETYIPNLQFLAKFNHDATDSSGNGFDGTWQSSEDYGEGVFTDDKSFKAGSSRYVLFGNQSKLNFDHTDAFSAGYWIKYTSTAAFFCLGKATGLFANGWDIGQRSADQRSRFTLEDVGGAGIDCRFDINSAPAMNDDKWHHVFFTYGGGGDGTSLTGYLDGRPVALSTVNDNVSGTCVTANEVSVGGSGTGTNIAPVGTYLDDCRVYDRELTAEEVKKIYEMTQSDVNPVRKMVKWKLGDGHSTNIPNQIHHWKLDNSLKDAKQDADGYLARGVEQYTDGVFGAAFDFNGTSRVDFPGTETDCDFDRTDEFSAMCWIKNDGSPSNSAWIMKGDNLTSAPGWYFFQNTNTAFISMAETNTTNEMRYKGTAITNDNKWHHVAMTKATGTGAAAEFKIYVDGVEDGASQTDTLTSGTITNVFPVTLGEEPSNDQNYTGQVDDVRIFDRELTAAEIKRIYEATSSFIDDPRDDNVPSDSIAINFEHKSHLEALKKVAKATGKDLFFDSQAHRVYIKTKGKEIKEKFSTMKISKPSFKLDNVANIVNIIGNDQSEGVQREKTFEDTNSLKYNYEKTIANKQIATDDTLNSVGQEVLTSLKDLTPDLSISTTPDQFNKFDLAVGDTIRISDLSQDLQGKYKIIKISADQKGIKLSLSSETNQTVQTAGKDLSSIMANVINAVQDLNITPE